MIRRYTEIARWKLVLLGILAITPILGGIISLGLLVLSLTIYRNKVLMIIGIIGILVTILFCFRLIYYGSHRGPFDQSRVITAKERMRDIFREIELYKLSYGKYPDNLNELKNNYPQLIIHDPIQDVNAKLSDHNFYYKVIGSKYYFFSKGFDGKPFTKDDILPSMIGINPNNTGIMNDSLSNYKQ